MALHTGFFSIFQKNKTEHSLREYLKQVLSKNKVIYDITNIVVNDSMLI